MHLSFLRICSLATIFCCLSTSLSAQEIRIGTWNIEHLGSTRDRRSLGTGFAQRPEELADYIVESKVDILALQEIGVHYMDGDRRKNKVLNEMMTILDQRTKGRWRYFIFQNRYRKDTTQLCGIAWNTAKVEQVGRHYWLKINDDPNDDFSLWDRKPHAMKFSLGNRKTDVVIMPIHMKSNSGRPSIEVSRVHRQTEAKALLEQLQSVKKFFKDDDIIILGDTNCLKKNEPALTEFTNARFRDLNDNDVPTTWNGPAPFDRILVPSDQGEFKECRLTVMTVKDPKEHRKRLSDHYIVVTTIKAQADDD